MSLEHKNLPSADRHEPIGFESAGTDTVYTKGSGWVKAPKDLETAASKQTYVADGAGSGAWQYAMVHAGIYYASPGTPITITGSGGTSDIAVSNHDLASTTQGTTFLTTTTTNGGAGPEFTSTNDGVLSYTGSLTRHFHVVATISCDLATGTQDTVKAVLYHWDASGGAWSQLIHSDVRQTVNNSTRASTAMHADIMMDAGDKIVVAFQNIDGTADVRLYTYYLFAMGMTGA